MDAAEWRAHYPFLTRPERRRWKKYVFFHKRDAARRPVLFFNFDRAALELPASETSELVRAIVSQARCPRMRRQSP